MAEKSNSKILKKLIIAIVVAIGTALAGYFSLDLTEKDIVKFVSPIIENVMPADETTDETPVVDETTDETPVVDDESTSKISE